MCYLMCIIFTGIFLFSTVKLEIFAYRHLRTLREIVKERVDDMEVYLYDISRSNDLQTLSFKMITEAKNHIKVSNYNSTRLAFSENVHY